jgi:5'-nucleotidase
LRVRILVTNDDGVHAPGLAALTRALAAWAAEDPSARQVVVVAPLANYSGASAAVGTVYEREAIAYKTAEIPGAESIETYGLDASPALSVIVSALGAFGPKPDLVCSGINLGVNVGRSVLHSGTVGAVLTGAQLGMSGLAVSLRSGGAIDHWETASALAVDTLPALAAAPPRTLLNLNVPSLPAAELKGVRRGRISTAGLIKAATGAASVAVDGTEPGSRARLVTGGDGEGEVHLTLGAAVPSLGDVGDEDQEDDGALVAAGFASLTPIVGVRENSSPDADDVVRAVLAALGNRP